MAKNDSYSCKLFGNKQRIKKNGKCALYYQVIINREIQWIPLNVDWDANFVDNQNGIILQTKKKDTDWQDMQLIISNTYNKITEIFKIYRIQDIPLSLESFKSEYKTFDTRNCFIEYMRSKIAFRYSIKEIVERTQYNHNSALFTFEQFRKFHATPFFTVTQTLFDKYKRFCLNELENEEETVKGRIAIFKKYLRLAKKDKIYIDSDVLEYKIGDRSRRLVWLDENEVGELLKLVDSARLTESENLSLKAFLFSCFTGLRISDIVTANHSWININNELDFIMQKNMVRKPKRIIIPLTDLARSLIPTRTGKFFNLEPATLNEKIKIASEMAGIKKHVTFHVGRHTFASLFIKKEGSLAILQELLGHSRIKDTMVYSHVHQDSKRPALENVQSMFVIKKLKIV